MPAKVILKIIEGPSTGFEAIFEEHTTVIIGRAPDCNIRLPNDSDHGKISRHHCLLELNPPEVRIRDFGSLHGTIVNDGNIGQRRQGMTMEEASKMEFPFVRLKSGDRIILGKTVFQVNVTLPQCCLKCGEEIPPNKNNSSMIPPPFCDCCKGKSSAEVDKPARTCSKCGAKETAERMGKPGEFICGVCQKDPFAVAKFLLNLAKQQKPELAAIQGYSIIDELGRGGMGAVYLAQNEKSGEKVALKVMLPRIALRNRAKQCFLRETESMKILKHPNIVQLHDAGCSNGTFFFTLDYCDGGTLEHFRIANRGKIAPKAALDIIFQVLTGLEFAHQVKCRVNLPDGSQKDALGIVHRDLKLDNIFFAKTNNAKVIKIGDFGLGKAFETAGISGLTSDGEYAGSPFFMPRQLVLNYRYAKPETDVWAAAACLYYLLCGFPPRDFPRGKIWYKVLLETDPVPIRKRDSSIPGPLAEVVDQALIDQPEIHFKSAKEFQTALEKVR